LCPGLIDRFRHTDVSMTYGCINYADNKHTSTQHSEYAQKVHENF